MEGALLQHARGMAAAIATTGGFTVTATLITPDNTITLEVTGLGTGTWMVFDDLRQGKPGNSASNSFDIPVSQLIAANYPYLSKGRINLLKHKVTVTDNAGMAGTFVIDEQHPNSTLGLIICILGRSA